MTRQEIYEQVVQLTSELHNLGVAEKIFTAASTGEAKNVKAVFKSFKKDNPELYERIVSFGEQLKGFVYRNTWGARIFGAEEDEQNGVTVYDDNTVNAQSFYALSFFANIDEACFFDWGTESSEVFLKAIEETGYEKLAKFVTSYSWNEEVEENKTYATLYDLLIAIFNGEFEETE